jgi:pimeloyl-ACP methyl ester carboxylesterase
LADSGELGTEREVRLSAGTVHYHERGEGRVVLFIHGVLMNADTWRHTVPLLADRCSCIAPDWPTGGHAVAMNRDADLSPSALADLVAEFIETLGLDDVTLVGIGLGTVLCEILAIRRPQRVGRIVFGPGDIVSTFPPGWARARFWVAFVPPLGRVAARALGVQAVRRRAYSRFSTRIDEGISASFVRGLTSNAAVRRDTLKMMRGIWRAKTGTDHERLRSFAKPALVVWALDDRAFPQDHADELARLLPDARVERIANSRTFVSLDRPQELAELIAEFVEST